MNPFFSVIIPIYNAELTIKNMITTLKSIDYKEVEFLLIDDGSLDKTYNTILNNINNDNRFKVFRKANEGPGPTRNYGIEHSIGKYVLFFDVDDSPEKNILSVYSKIIQENQEVDLIVSSFNFRTISKGETVSEKKYLVEDFVYKNNLSLLSDMYELMSKQLMYVVWNKCYRKDIIEDHCIRFKNYRSCEDRIFNLDYFQYCNKTVVNSTIVYNYLFDSEKGITNQYFSDKYSTFKEFYILANKITNNQQKEGMASLLLKGATSVILSIIQTTKISKKQKQKEIQMILSDDCINEAKRISLTDGFLKKIIKTLYNTPVHFFIFMLTFGSLVESHLPSLMAIMKKKY